MGILLTVTDLCLVGRIIIVCFVEKVDDSMPANIDVSPAKDDRNTERYIPRQTFGCGSLAMK